VIPVLTGIFAIAIDLKYYKTNSTGNGVALFVFQMLIGLLQSISFAFLGVALVRIRRHIKEHGFIGELNNKMLTLNAICFSMYLLGGIILYWNYSRYMLDNNIEYRNRVITSHAICCIIECLAELTIAAIFYEKYQLRECKREVLRRPVLDEDIDFSFHEDGG
jgi:uncharacterized membrane protein YidH (DUF202 family)